MFSYSALQAKTICTNQNLTYLVDMKSFGIPQIPVGTPLGVKSLVFNGQLVAQNNFVVTNPNNWTDYQDWNYQAQLSQESVVWVNPRDNNEKVLTAVLTFVDSNSGDVIVSNEKVTCVVNQLLAP